jgi:hypothetical protein
VRPALALALFTLSVPTIAFAVEVHGVPLPKGARSVDKDRFVSPKSFRDTAQFYRKELAKKGWSADFLPVEKVRDVVYLRILSKTREAPWSAIHIVLAEGKTTIYILASEKELGDRLTAGRWSLEPSI